MTPEKCKKHNIKLECIGGESAHWSNWYCPECDKEELIPPEIVYVTKLMDASLSASKECWTGAKTYIRKDIHENALKAEREKAIAAERERCAKVAENLPPITINRKAHRQACEDIAEAIRGGEK